MPKAKPYTVEHANQRAEFFKNRGDERHDEGQRLLLLAEADYDRAAKLRAEELESNNGAAEREQLWQSTLNAARDKAKKSKAKKAKAEDKAKDKDKAQTPEHGYANAP